MDAPRLNVEDLTVGEHLAMQLASASWAVLYKIKTKYLRGLIEKMSQDKSESSVIALPIFKLVLFFAENLQETMKQDPRLIKAIEDAQIKADVEQAMGGM